MMCEVTAGCLDRVCIDLRCYLTPTSHTCDPEKGTNKPHSPGGGWQVNPHPEYTEQRGEIMTNENRDYAEKHEEQAAEEGHPRDELDRLVDETTSSAMVCGLEEPDGPERALGRHRRRADGGNRGAGRPRR